MTDKIPGADYRGLEIDEWPPIPAKFLKAYEHGLARIAGGEYSARQKADGHRWLHWLMCEWSVAPQKKEKRSGSRKRQAGK